MEKSQNSISLGLFAKPKTLNTFNILSNLKRNSSLMTEGQYITMMRIITTLKLTTGQVDNIVRIFNGKKGYDDILYKRLTLSEAHRICHILKVKEKRAI